MPTIPAMTVGPTTVDAAQVYTGGLFDPVNPPDTLEILHGGLDDDNYGGGANSIPARCFQLGSFGLGWYAGFDRWEFTYARQLSDDQAATYAVRHAGLSTRLFLPWTASVVFYGYQGWFTQDATYWNFDDGNPANHVREYWELGFNRNGTPEAQMLARLPFTRDSTDLPGTDPYVDDPGDSAENRWRWVHKMSVDASVAAGYQTFDLVVRSNVKYRDGKTAKVITRSGGIFVLALR